MMIRRDDNPLALACSVDPNDPWPAEVDLILSALEAGGHRSGAGAAKPSPGERRSGSRIPYRVRAQLELFVDAAGAEPWLLYTRELSRRGMGFITPNRLPLGYGGTVKFPGPDGRQLCIAATLLRCREAAPGWFEGSLYFNREQELLIE
jgi:hypothetical protein